MKTQPLKTLPIIIAALALSAAGSLAVPIALGGLGSTGTDTSGIQLLSGAAVVPSSGTGVFDPFLQIQRTGQPGASETGFNSNVANGDTKQNKANGTGHTRDLLFSDLATVLYNGINSYQISLDLNFSGGTGVTADIFPFQLFAHDLAAITSTQLATLTPAISLVDTWTLTNINGGSGLGDVQFYIPVSAFTGVFGGKTYLTLNTTMSPYDDGFEEFAAVQGRRTTVPDGGATVALLALALTGMGAFRKFRKGN